MAEIGTHWERCGNTPYYRSGEGLTWYFSDPFSWRFISTVPQKTGTRDEGVVSVLLRAPARYEWEALKEGARMLGENQDVLRATHQWFADQVRAKSAGLPPRELRRLFESAPPEARALVLRGVRAVAAGAEMNDPSDLARIILVVPSGSTAESQIEEVERSFDGKVIDTVVDKYPERGLERALSVFGIHEC
jgi:hypothetical protein